ncbi:MAG TPA: hypothetical protein VNG93_13480 [Candidatus Dormibacteraeota bacterium]|nr:hypothetical protein [Candidatus Dormibacteraeota bacterium]
MALLEASRDTGLRQFYPFTSVNRLCLARGSQFPLDDIQPAHVEFFPDLRYVVRKGSPYPPDYVAPIDVNTDDAAAAISALTRLLGV